MVKNLKKTIATSANRVLAAQLFTKASPKCSHGSKLYHVRTSPIPNRCLKFANPLHLLSN